MLSLTDPCMCVLNPRKRQLTPSLTDMFLYYSPIPWRAQTFLEVCLCLTSSSPAEGIWKKKQVKEIIIRGLCSADTAFNAEAASHAPMKERD